MALQSFSNAFLDWARERVLAASDGLVSGGCLFDEREQGLGELIRKSLASKLGYCVALSLASAKRVAVKESPDDTVHRVSCTVAVFRSALAAGLSLAECAWLAESLYVAFCGAYFSPVPGTGRPDVHADDFVPRVEANGAAVFTFTIAFEKDIDVINN